MSSASCALRAEHTLMDSRTILWQLFNDHCHKCVRKSHVYPCHCHNWLFRWSAVVTARVVFSVFVLSLTIC